MMLATIIHVSMIHSTVIARLTAKQRYQDYNNQYASEAAFTEAEGSGI